MMRYVFGTAMASAIVAAMAMSIAELFGAPLWQSWVFSVLVAIGLGAYVVPAKGETTMTLQLRNLVRTRRGMMIHRASCSHARQGVPWLWADRATDEELADAIARFSYRPCQACDPLT